MMSVREAARAVQGEWSGEDTDFSGVSTDRRSWAGRSFIALVGDKFDGRGFIAEVKEKGAVAVMVCHEFHAGVPDRDSSDTGGKHPAGIGATGGLLAGTVQYSTGCGNRQQRQDHREGNDRSYLAPRCRHCTAYRQPGRYWRRKAISITISACR